MMMLPTTPSNRWMRQLDNPFRLFEGRPDAFDDYQIYEEEDEFVLTIDMPGFEPDEITVSWDDGVLNVAAEHVDEERGREKTYHRRFRFPKSIDDGEIAARYNNGVLELVLPLEEGATVLGRQIPIES